MKKLPKLYIKNDRGRYEEYKIPEIDISNTLYRKINGKYVPVSYLEGNNSLPEGIWVVTRGISSIEYISGQYLKELMQLDKVSDIKEMPNIAELGGWQKCAKYVLKSDCINRDKLNTMSINDIVYAIIGKVYEYSKQN